ncbi:MAG TPA: hypothetical protein H9853_10270 [Candidatus Sphingobacterium stercoripullorum]|uniref:Uncharacterized protein n=1 Tax=Candidatus Sphingobacterium stercoripullorum TaxID=2838759 RepID=A0A9D2AZA8_9SPHI|nr:hypothetical protein [Candidatus Sphingobacterium stercoripullorum]
MSIKTLFSPKKKTTDEIDPIKPIPRNIASKVEKDGYDLEYLQRIQSHGGITFDDKHINSGDGYYQILTIFAYPQDPDIRWLWQVSNYENTIMTADIGTESTEAIRKQADRTLNELKDRALNGRKATRQNDAEDEYANVLQYMADLTQNGEIAKKIVIRLFVYDAKLEDLEDRVKRIKNDLKSGNYKADTYLFTQAQQFKTLSKSLGEQEKEFLSLPVAPQQMKAVTLGGGVPFSHQELLDPHGVTLGQTTTEGPFIFDQFAKTPSRSSYNMMILGKMGAGKSTLMKMLEEGAFARNNIIRGIDKTREYEYLIKKQGGVVVSLDGSEGMMNPLQVSATSIDAKTGKINELESFYSHLNKVTILFRMINGDSLDPIELQEFTSLLRKFYISIGMLPKDFQHNKDKIHICDLDPMSYPTMSDFSRWIDKLVTKEFLLKINATTARQRTFEKIKSSLHNLVENYGQLFDGHSTIKDLSKEKIVMFDTSEISTMDPNIYHAQLFSAISILWNHALINGRRQNSLLEAGKITKADVQYCDVFLDECHNIINPDNMFAVKYISDFEREMRKFWAGVILATQSPEEMVPDNVETAELGRLKTIFQLCQYKVMMGMDPSVLEKIKRLMGDSLTDADYEAIPDLVTGEAIFSLGSKDRYKVSLVPNERQLKDFHGGE